MQGQNPKKQWGTFRRLLKEFKQRVTKAWPGWCDRHFEGIILRTWQQTGWLSGDMPQNGSTDTNLGNWKILLLSQTGKSNQVAGLKEKENFLMLRLREADIKLERPTVTVFIMSPFGLIFACWFPGSPVELSVRKVGDRPVWCHCCISSLQQCLTHSRCTKNVLGEQWIWNCR